MSGVFLEQRQPVMSVIEVGPKRDHAFESRADILRAHAGPIGHGGIARTQRRVCDVERQCAGPCRSPRCAESRLDAARGSRAPPIRPRNSGSSRDRAEMALSARSNRPPTRSRCASNSREARSDKSETSAITASGGTAGSSNGSRRAALLHPFAKVARDRVRRFAIDLCKGFEAG